MGGVNKTACLDGLRFIHSLKNNNNKCLFVEDTMLHTTDSQPYWSEGNMRNIIFEKFRLFK